MAFLYLKRLIFYGERPGVSPPKHRPLEDALSALDIERADSPSSEQSTLCDRSEDGMNIVEEKCALVLRDARIVSDAIIGLSDGLTVPFALSAGLSALGDSKIVIYGGLAELFAGVISMGLGGYLGSRSEVEAFATAKKATESIVFHDRKQAENEIIKTLSDFELPDSLTKLIFVHLESSPSMMVDFIMRFQHQMKEAEFHPHRAYISALTIGLGYFVGGFIPLLPYFFLPTVADAFFVSVVVMAFSLFLFGTIKTVVVRGMCFPQIFIGGLQMVVLGGLAAAAAMGCVKAIT